MNQPPVHAVPINQQPLQQQQMQQQQVIMQQQGMYPQQQQMIMQQQGMYPQQQQMQVMPMNGVMVIQPNIMTNIQPPFPNEGDWVAKYGGSTFQCCDDPTCCCYSMFCLPCANGQACAWGNAINGNGDVAAQICANIVIDVCCDFICHSCMAANAHVAVEGRISRKHGSMPNQQWMNNCCCHFWCTPCEQAKLQRAIKKFKELHGPMGQPEEVEMKR